MQEDLRWAMEHYNELDQRYHGESIVVWKKQVIAHGNGEAELLQQAASDDRPRATRGRRVPVLLRDPALTGGEDHGIRPLVRADLGEGYSTASGCTIPRSVCGSSWRSRVAARTRSSATACWIPVRRFR